MLVKVREQALVERLFVQRGLEINLHTVLFAAEMAHMRTRGQHQRTGQTEVREQHFTEVRVELLLVFIHGQLHVAQAETHQLLTGVTVLDERHERRICGHDRVPCLPGKAVAGRAGLRIGCTTGRYDHAIRLVRLVTGANACEHTVLDEQLVCGRMYDGHTRLFHPQEQRVDDVGCLVRLREHAVAALCFERHAAALEKVHHVRRTESAERGIQKARIDRHVAQNLLHIAVIAHVAAALARDKQLAANFFVGFQQRHLRALLRGSTCRHQTGCAAADYDNVQFISSSGFSYTSYSSQMRSSLLNVCSISSRRLMPTATISALMTDKGATSESTKLAISLRASST